MVRALHKKIDSVMGVFKNPSKITILLSSYVQSLGENYVNFSPLGFNSIHSRWIENKRSAENAVAIWKNIK